MLIRELLIKYWILFIYLFFEYEWMDEEKNALKLKWIVSHFK